MTESMRSKVVVVTGGVRGLGRTMADFMAREGAAVWVTSRQAPPPHPSLVAAAGEVRAVRLDVTDEASVKELFAQVDAAYGRLDVLVNNAGVGVFKPVVETTLAEWDTMLRTNLTGTFLCSKEAFRRMQRQGGGRIITIASVSGYIPIVENGAYGASKYGVRGFCKILNEEGKAHSIRVSLVSPGAAYTDIWEGREGFDPRDMLQPEDIAESVLDIARRPLHVRIDEVKLLPPKGVL
ncbi:SDR family oxidoreductase [Hyalangium rubrum]|uniref:SDR family oxidoreductase n=1 Tax=Hyalangium rubrum TaxID=3103134 RepID=A0ABU5H609_9BACT|nr:SDR family oxidoreductase [Hyalangium sp. s54d21]MDY7228192.1 SDR family oxidoreductase [Hyalangium sp. s54d21]